MAVHFALLGLSEHAFFLSSMTPDGLFLDLSTAQLFFTDYKFDLTKKVCETITGKVPFSEFFISNYVEIILIISKCKKNTRRYLKKSIDNGLKNALYYASWIV